MTWLAHQLLLSAASAVIPLVEAEAIAYYSEHQEELNDKSGRARLRLRDLYKQLSDRVPALAATELDDALVQGALDQAWERLDDRVKQAARLAKEQANAKVTDPLVYTDAPEAGRPTTDKDFGVSLRDQINQK